MKERIESACGGELGRTYFVELNYIASYQKLKIYEPKYDH